MQKKDLLERAIPSTYTAILISLEVGARGMVNMEHLKQTISKHEITHLVLGVESSIMESYKICIILNHELQYYCAVHL